MAKKIKKIRMKTVVGEIKTLRVQAILQPTRTLGEEVHWFWIVPVCPYCANSHIHRVDGGLSANPFRSLGLRSAHCKDIADRPKYFIVYGGLAPYHNITDPVGRLTWEYQSNPDAWLKEIRGKYGKSLTH